MNLSAWKQKLASLPVLGNLVVGLRGVYSLGTWRAELRQQQSEHHARLDAQEAMLQGVRQELAGLRQDCADLRSRIVALAEDLTGLQQEASRAQAWQAQTLEERARVARLTNTMAWLTQRLDRLDIDVARTRSVVGQAVLREALNVTEARAAVANETGASAPTGVHASELSEATTRADALVGLKPELQSLSEVLEKSETWQHWQHIFAGLPESAQDRALNLEAVPLAAWTSVLGSGATTDLALIVGRTSEGPDAASLKELLQAAQAALAPGGMVGLELPNGANLLAVARALECGRSLGLTPARAAEVAAECGLIDVRTLAFDGTPLPGSEVDSMPADVAQLLAQPARYCLFARKVV